VSVQLIESPEPLQPQLKQLRVELTGPPGMTKVATSHGTVRIIVTAMTVAPFIVWM
jgi:hypothetical protein